MDPDQITMLVEDPDQNAPIYRSGSTLFVEVQQTIKADDFRDKSGSNTMCLFDRIS